MTGANTTWSTRHQILPSASCCRVPAACIRSFVRHQTRVPLPSTCRQGTDALLHWELLQDWSNSGDYGVPVENRLPLQQDPAQLLRHWYLLCLRPSWRYHQASVGLVVPPNRPCCAMGCRRAVGHERCTIAPHCATVRWSKRWPDAAAYELIIWVL
jgi:hypothetical protein